MNAKSASFVSGNEFARTPDHRGDRADGESISPSGKQKKYDGEDDLRLDHHPGDRVLHRRRRPAYIEARAGDKKCDIKEW